MVQRGRQRLVSENNGLNALFALHVSCTNHKSYPSPLQRENLSDLQLAIRGEMNLHGEAR